MKAFWWFKQNSIAGMARPGFNSIHWFALPFEEAAMMGWIGQYSSGTMNLESFREHLRTYVPKIYKFYKMDERTGAEAIKIFSNVDGIMSVLRRLNQRVYFLEKFSMANDQLSITMSEVNLQREIVLLKKHGIARVVCLTEQHHDKEFLRQHFPLHHIGIADLGAPEPNQVHQLTEVIKLAEKNGEKLAVHCLAGIGRTTTMLMAAHLLMGETFQDLQERVARQNPKFVLTGQQQDFIYSLVSKQ